MNKRIALLTAALLIGLASPALAQDNASTASRVAPNARVAETTKSKPVKKSVRKKAKTRNAKKSARAPRFIGNSSFNLATNGFSFANWQGEPISQDTSLSLLVQLFGEQSICQEITAESGCVPFAKAAQFSEQLALSIAAGRCEGMSVLASSLFARGANAASLSQSEVESEILYWWASQILPSVTEVSRKTRQLDPVELLPLILKGISQGASSTLGLYNQGQGHTLLPFKSSQAGNVVTIDVYDSNTPGIPQQLVINTTKKSWTYQSFDASGQSTLLWSGIGAGSLDVVPLSARQPQATSYFNQ